MKALGLLGIVVALWYLLKGKSASSAPAVPSPAAPALPSGGFSSAWDDLEEGIKRAEGTDTSLNMRNNNPGDLKAGPNMTGTNQGIATFADVGDGWDALGAWIKSHISQHPDWDFYDMGGYYLRGSTTAPTTDAEGNSDQWAENVASYMGVSPTQQVSSVLGVGKEFLCFGADNE
jgi:hypothetical protein